MPIECNYNLCRRHRGRAVAIRGHDGGEHRGIIQNVNNQQVFIQPIGGRRRGYGGVGYGIALGSIATLALIPFFLF